MALAVVSVVAASVFWFTIGRASSPGEARGLGVGDCFDAPTLEGQTVENVQHHPCTELHSGEVFAVVKNPAGTDAAYPDQPARAAFAGDQCAAPFLAYIGIAMDASGLDIRYFGPTSDGWSKGDRTFICYVNSEPAVGTSIKGSAK